MKAIPIILSVLLLGGALQADQTFIRGRCNGDEKIDLADPIFLLEVLFVCCAALTVEEAQEISDKLADSQVCLLNIVFLGHTKLTFNKIKYVLLVYARGVGLDTVHRTDISYPCEEISLAINKTHRNEVQSWLLTTPLPSLVT